MDQQISIKKFFNYCFNSARFRRKSKENENSENTINKRNYSDPVLKTKTMKSRFHKFISRNDTSSKQNKKRFANGTNSNDGDEAAGINPPLATKKTKSKRFSTCFKKYSSGDEAISTVPVKRLPVILTKLDIDTTIQRGFKEENCIKKEPILSAWPSQSQELETDAARHYSHNSAVELMSRDGTLKLYSATTLTPLSSSTIQDEERIQTHLSVSCFRPENHTRYSSSDGPDDVFEANDEVSTHLASNFQNFNIEHSKRVSDNCGPGIPRNKKSHLTRHKGRGPLVKNFISADKSLGLYANGKEEKLQTYPSEKRKNKENPVPNYCPCLEPGNAISCIYDAQRVPRTSTIDDTYQIASNFTPSCPKHDQRERSACSCTSVTSHIPSEVSPAKKWILQLYFNSLVAASENLQCKYGNIYTNENNTEYSSPPFDSKIFNQTVLEGQHFMEACARRSLQTDSIAASHKYPPARSTIKSEEYFERQRLDTEDRNFKTTHFGLLPKHEDHYYAGKENKLKRSRVKSVSTTAKSQRRPTRDKCRNSKPAIFSEDITYTHYPFIDGPFAKNFEKITPIVTFDETENPGYEQ